jgi:sterol desaturase/sphingolipid hydroxylase (fatty acid hydroxylase superfamily)
MNNMAEHAHSLRSENIRPNTTRMFETEIFERFSRIHPATPFVAWLPIVAFMLYRSLSRGGGLTVMALFIAGFVTWTLAEYVLHRYMFHWVNDTPWGRRIHFVLHGVHHDYPNDKDRLVMPLGASLPMGLVFYVMFFALFGIVTAEPIFAGFVVGYLFYDGSHYAIHHFKMKSALGRWIKRHHMLHHHVDNDGGFGVSTPIWDYVFQTLPQPKRKQPKPVSPTA